ncbi:MAG: DUF1273 family protein [Oscillospiraceae bacterium]|nr:DUF1273 family protein [Oscillospiraceae bacterium]
MREKTFCFSGHRNIPDHDLLKIQRRTEDMIHMLLTRGYRYAAVGGALGYDLMALRLLLRLKEEYPHLRIIGVFPFPGYDSKWTLAQREEYAALIPQLDKLVYTVPADKASNSAFLERNKKMVDGSSALICYYDERQSRSGTGQCVRYAQRNHLEIYNVASDTFLR